MEIAVLPNATVRLVTLPIYYRKMISAIFSVCNKNFWKNLGEISATDLFNFGKDILIKSNVLGRATTGYLLRNV